ncbi:hypothetical protein HPB52_024768 [Rhipicephalus sanguineus]|uniref:Uncharacterized protein n=1 Tax=Rhipicephalus sanguineus TaxID=34632 RepID=A0A9D4TDW3_RHISA|nr:hypothetical protein HPB52_024768 [Rhipicephalus sanguineus]
MDAEPWRLVRGKRRRARSSDSSDERPAAACGGPGDLEEGLPGVKRTAAADSDSESTSPPSRAVPRDLGGSEWDAVKASVAECFREWGKRRHARSGAEIKIVSDAILLLSKPLSVVEVRQGDPLSPALYVLAFEPLLQRLSSDNSIDDLSIVVPTRPQFAPSWTSWRGTARERSQDNRSQSVVMYLNSAPSSPRPVHGPTRATTPTYSGVFHFEPDGLTTENWRLAKQKLTDRIQEISAYGMPIDGQTSVMPVATRTKLVLEGLLFRFLWSGSSMYVARPVIKLPRNKGGLGIPDLGIVATALHLRWTRVALESDMLLTRSFASFFLSTRLRLFSPEAFLTQCLGRELLQPFYAGAASTLARLRDANPGIELDSLELHDLVDLLTPDLPAHCVRYDLSRHSPNWKLIHAIFLDAKRATFMYRMARGCLPITFRPFTKIPTRR